MAIRTRQSRSTPAPKHGRAPAAASTHPARPSTTPAKAGARSGEKPLAGEQSRLLDTRATDFAAGQRQDRSDGGKGARSAIAVRADLLADSKAAPDTALESSVGSATDAVETVFTWTSPPDAPDPTAPGDGALAVDIDGRNATTSVGVVRPTHEVAVSGSLDAYGFSLDVSKRRADREHGAGIYLMHGYAELSGSSSHANSDGTSRGLSGGLFYEPGGGGVTGSLAIKTAAGVTARMGGFVGGNLVRKVVDHGDYAGDQPALRGTRCVELNRTRNAYGVLLPGFSLDLGVGGRLGLTKGCTVSYTTHVPREQARALLFEDGNRLTRGLRNCGRALGIVDEPLPPPSLAQLDQIKVGDRVALATEGALSGGVVAGLAAIGYVGVQTAVRGEFELTVERPSQDQLRVTVVPTKVDTIQVSGRTIVLDATSARSKARALSRSYTFDLKQPAAVAAYQALLKGELPGGGSTKDSHAAPGQPPAQSDNLPPGVAHTATEWLSGRFVRHHIDLGFTLLEWGRASNHADFEHRVERDLARLDERVRAVDSCRSVPLSGDESRGIRASLMSVSSYDPTGKVDSQFAGLRLIAYVNDTKARGLELNDDIDAVNRAFGTDISHFHEPSLKNARAIAIESTLGEAELATLAALPPSQVKSAAAAAETPLRPLQTLVRALRDQADPRQRADLVQDYLAANGFAAMGALVRMLGADHIALSTTNGDLEALLDAARTLIFKYEQPIAIADSEELVQRFEEIEKLDAKLIKLRALVGDDPLLDAVTRADGLAQIDAARAALQRALSLEQLDAGQRRTLIDQLGSGWVTAREARIIALLEPAD